MRRKHRISSCSWCGEVGFRKMCGTLSSVCTNFKRASINLFCVGVTEPQQLKHQTGCGIRSDHVASKPNFYLHRQERSSKLNMLVYIRRMRGVLERRKSINVRHLKTLSHIVKDNRSGGLVNYYCTNRTLRRVPKSI